MAGLIAKWPALVKKTTTNREHASRSSRFVGKCSTRRRNRWNFLEGHPFTYNRSLRARLSTKTCTHPVVESAQKAWTAKDSSSSSRKTTRNGRNYVRKPAGKNTPPLKPFAHRSHRTLPHRRRRAQWRRDHLLRLSTRRTRRQAAQGWRQAGDHRVPRLMSSMA